MNKWMDDDGAVHLSICLSDHLSIQRHPFPCDITQSFPAIN